MIMVTTETELEQVERPSAAGSSEFVMKPLIRDMIAEKLGVVGLLD